MVAVLSPIVELEDGKLQGTTLTTRNGKVYYGYLGIPYAKKPLRFQPPEPSEKWEGVRDATKFGKRCFQRSSATKLIEGSEDCLFLNVFTNVNVEENAKKIPVMVFIHGGGFSLGGGDQYGGKYICDEDVILVTINYRLGALGFLSTGDGLIKGNMGLKDQVMALKWVQKNIGAFGGNKSAVTIFGESAGAGCVHYHILSKASTGLFASAIMQSGSSLAPWARNKRPASNAKRLGKLLGISTEDMSEFVNQLMKLDARAISAQSMNFLEPVPTDLPIYFAPAVEDPWEGAIFTETPYDIIISGNIANPVPTIIGVNSDEGLYRTLPVLKNSEKLAALNQYWSIASPMVLVFNKDMVPNADEFSNSARDFYLGENGTFSEATLEGFTNMLSDRFFNCSTDATVKLHAKVQRDPNNIYAYIFAHKGEFSMLNIFKIQEVIGVSHGDELQYLMDQTVHKSNILPDSEDDAVSRKLVQMWTNFAKEGRPSYEGGQSFWEKVKPDEPIGWYRIEKGCSDKMITCPFGKRMEFWENLAWNQFLC